MVDRRRIEQPNVDINAITIHINEAKDLANIPDLSERGKALAELYDATGEQEAHELLMIDICLTTMADIKNLPTAKTTKTRIYNEYCLISGMSRRSAERHFKKAQAKIKKMHNLGMMVHHAASVAQDVVSRLYSDLDRLNEQQTALEEQIEDHDPNTEDGKKAINSLEFKIGNIISKKDRFYEQLMNYAKEFGVNLSIKSEQNVINEQKNEILSQKFDNDAAWQKADVAIRFKDMSPEEKRKALIQAISSDKAITEAIESTYEVKVIEDV